MREKPEWGSREEKENNMITEAQANEQCMGDMAGSKMVGACQKAAVMALREAMATIQLTTNFIVGY